MQESFSARRLSVLPLPFCRQSPTRLAAYKESEPYRVALDMLLGHDPGCANFLDAYRQGELELAAR